VIAEIVVLAAVGAIPGGIPGRVVPGAIAFVAAAQVSTFRSLDGVEYSTTLTTSNHATMSAVTGMACSASRGLGQAMAGQGVGPAQGVGQPMPAGHVLDEVGGVGARHPGGGDVQRPG